jgi:hypothetical protein
LDTEDQITRLELLKAKHKKQHAIVEALETERVAEHYITEAKRIKLRLKDEIASIESSLKMQGVKC